MDKNRSSKVVAFDTLFSTNHIQMLKVLLPYADHQTQKTLAVYIKFLELNYTLDFYRKHPFPLCGCVQQEETPDIGCLCEELLPFCTEAEKQKLLQIKNIFQSMEMYREMSKTMDLMKDFMPPPGAESGDGADAGSFDVMNVLMNMLSPEQKQMFELFGGNSNAE